MEFSKIEIPYIGNDNIKKIAERFRLKFCGNSIPVEIENIIEFKLKLNIFPEVDMFKKCGADALITSNWKSIYVDNESFLDKSSQNRLRFSFAHEIGHLVMHKKLWGSFEIKNVKDYLNFYDQITKSQYGYIETQANKFANFLLVPRNRLDKEKKKVLKKTSSDFNLDLKIIDKETLNSYLAIPLADIFYVSQDVMEIALSDM